MFLLKTHNIAHWYNMLLRINEQGYVFLINKFLVIIFTKLTIFVLMLGQHEILFKQLFTLIKSQHKMKCKLCYIHSHNHKEITNFNSIKNERNCYFYLKNYHPMPFIRISEYQCETAYNFLFLIS